MRGIDMFYWIRLFDDFSVIVYNVITGLYSIFHKFLKQNIDQTLL